MDGLSLNQNKFWRNWGVPYFKETSRYKLGNHNIHYGAFITNQQYYWFSVQVLVRLFKPTPRYDKYESKSTYWVESELEAEWEKTTTRAIRESGEFHV